MCVLHLVRQGAQNLERDVLKMRELSCRGRHVHLVQREMLCRRQLNLRVGSLYRRKQLCHLEQEELNLRRMCHLYDRHNLANQMLLCGVENGENQGAL